MTRFLCLVLCATALWAQEDLVALKSPDGRIEIRLFNGPPASYDSIYPHLAYQIDFQGKRLMDTSYLGFDIDQQLPLGHKLGLLNVTRESTPRFNEAIAQYLQNGSLGRLMTMEVRAYNEGVAFRYVVPNTAYLPSMRLLNELTQFVFAKDGNAYPLQLRDFRTAYDDQYTKVTLSGIHPESLIGLPLLVQQPGVGWAAVTESGIEDYAGMYLEHQNGQIMRARLSPRLDGSIWSVLVDTPMVTPWRVILINDHPEKFAESSLIPELNAPTQLKDTSWIRPGKILAASTGDVDSKIDFAAASGIDYVLVDDATPELIVRATAKKVGVWIHRDWRAVEGDMAASFPQYEKLGVRGIKVAGMHRDDQDAIVFYRKVAALAAQHHLMLAFEGAFKPDGLEQTFPHVLTRDAAMGSSYAQQGARVSPEHNVMLAFSRVLAGPLDYAPGGFDNVTPAAFEAREGRPMTLGTRAHQLALFVLFASPLQTLADTPDAYRNERDFDFIKAVPVVWDETRAITGQVGEFIAIARRKGRDWFIGAITNDAPRELDLPLAFLGTGPFTAEIYADAPDAAANPKHTALDRRSLQASDTIHLKLAPGGGAAIRLHP